jgi:Chalcone isomerase-like
MKRSLLFVLVCVMRACGIGMAHGKACQGVNFPEQMQLDGGTLALNGLGLRQATILKVNVYVAALYVAKASSDAHTLLGSNTPKELILHFVHNVSDDDLKKGWEEGFEHNAKEQLPALKERIERLQGWMADMQSGQWLTFLHTPGAGLQVEVKGTVQGTIPGDDFATAFLSIWLGAHPPNPDLKSGLLGGACE